MRCPLLNHDCREDCAWYLSHKDTCSVSTLANEMKLIEKDADGVREALMGMLRILGRRRGQFADR